MKHVIFCMAVDQKHGPMFQVYLGFKFCPSVLEAVGLLVPTVFSMFTSASSIKNCPCARCTSAVNAVCRDSYLFNTKIVSVSHILY
jgi:hypothetical protein